MNSFRLGREFEHRFEELTGAKPTPASGNQWHATMDFEGGRLLWSLKWTGKLSFPVTARSLDEVVEAVEAPGGRGGDTIPALCFDVGGEVIAAMRLHDLMRVVEEKVPISSRASKRSEERAARASTPQLLRPDREEQ